MLEEYFDMPALLLMFATKEDFQPVLLVKNWYSSPVVLSQK